MDEEATPAADEEEDPSALARLCEMVSDLETRVAQLETVAHSGHHLDPEAINHIGKTVLEKLNHDIRNKFNLKPKGP